MLSCPQLKSFHCPLPCTSAVLCAPSSASKVMPSWDPSCPVPWPPLPLPPPPPPPPYLGFPVVFSSRSSTSFLPSFQFPFQLLLPSFLLPHLHLHLHLHLGSPFLLSGLNTLIPPICRDAVQGPRPNSPSSLLYLFFLPCESVTLSTV
jgi:hypothetical protein